MAFSEQTEEVSPAAAAPKMDDGFRQRTAIYDVACRYLESAFTLAAKGKAFSMDPILVLMKRLAVPFPPDDPLIIQAIHQDDPSVYIIRHGVNVAVFSMRIGEELGFDRRQLTEIGMAGLLHDLGMSRIPGEILYKPGELSKADRKIMRRHTEHGYSLLKGLGKQFAFMAECALNHHERADGSGYPAGLKSGEIHEYAQIIGLADMYETTIHSRPYRTRRHPFSAIKDILSTGKHLFNRRYLRALLTAFSIFPIHTYVRLNSGAVGRVIATYPDQPMRPKLRIEFDSRGRRVLTERIVNLPEDSLLYIKDAVRYEDLEELLKL